MTRIEAGQAFEHQSALCSHEAAPEKLMHEVVLPWVLTLPRNPGPILDLAAGQGIEAKFLSDKGYYCVGSDLSQLMTRNSQNARRIRAKADSIPLKDQSLSGGFMKDAWGFLSPEMKQHALEEIKRVLVYDGSFLIVTQLGSCMRIYYTENSSRYGSPLKDTYDNDSNWQEVVSQL